MMRRGQGGRGQRRCEERRKKDDGGDEEEVRREKERGGERGPEVGGCETRAHALRGRLPMIETPF